jgi:hypothetical protein
MHFWKHYDENSQEFKNAFEGYRTVIEKTDDHNDMLRNIAYIVAKYGCGEIIEGCGVVSINGKKQINYITGKERTWCGVDVVGDVDLNDTIDYDVELDEEDENN